MSVQQCGVLLKCRTPKLSSNRKSSHTAETMTLHEVSFKVPWLCTAMIPGRRLDGPWFSSRGSILQQLLLAMALPGLLALKRLRSLLAAELPMLQHEGGVCWCRGLCRNSCNSEMMLGILGVSVECCSTTRSVLVDNFPQRSVFQWILGFSFLHATVFFLVICLLLRGLPP